MANGCRHFPRLYRLDWADVAARTRALFAIGDPPFQTKSGAAEKRKKKIPWAGVVNYYPRNQKKTAFFFLKKPLSGFRG